MSFFRVLFALLISGGIAYGLYYVVEQQKMEGPSRTEAVAERADIADAGNAEHSVEPVAEADTDATAEPQAEETLVERTTEAVGEAEPAVSTGDDAPTSTPEAPDADTAASDAAAALPAAAIAPVTSDSVDALGIVTGGMTYGAARETLIDGGWTPRAIEQRGDAPDATETALIDAGYTELEGCSDAERAICRFEFVDGQKRIAAVLTAGSDGDPSVIDAFLMDIARTE